MLILELPERIALCAYDASTLIRFTAHTRQATLDTLKRPAVLIEANEGDYPPRSAGLAEPTETFLLSVIGQKYGQGSKVDAEAELEVRRVAHDIAVYFFKRTQLQFSDQRGENGGALGPLRGVKWCQLTRRTFVTSVTREENEGTFWGTEFSLTVTMDVRALEVLIPNLG